jgi:hypothetical protein
VDTTKSSASAHDSPSAPEMKSGRCEACGVSSQVKTLVGLKNDRRRNGPRFCLPHHPDSMAGCVRSGSLVEAL